MSIFSKGMEILNSSLSGIPFSLRRKQWDHVRYFCLFLGYPRSGHTLVGALLNAHPKVLIAHEFFALRLAGTDITREKLFSELVRRDKWFQDEKAGLWEGYEYRLEGFHQGKSGNIRVIGDKSGGASVKALRDNPDALTQMADLVQVPLRVIQYIRNPFDNITTMNVRHGNRSLDTHIRNYFFRTELIRTHISGIDNSAVCQIWHEEFCRETEPNIRKLINFLGEETDAGYEAACRKAVYSEPKVTRHDVDWTAEQIKRVEDKCKEYPFLERYSFDG